jgi:plastocyanin
MKKFYLLICLLMTAWMAQSQLVINEIMYNSPESNNDSLEYIEVLNAGTSPYNMAGVKFMAGVTYTFGNITLPAGGLVLVAVDSVAIKTVFNVSAFQWVGALSNNGEGIVLVDANGAVLDEVTYDDVAPWPVEPDDQGPSLVLCDPTSNNGDGANWVAAKNGTGIILNGKEIKGSPGVANAISCAVVPSVFVDVKDFSFTPKDITIDPGTTVRWTNTGGTHNINGTQAVFPNNPESFGNGPAKPAQWTYDFTFTKVGLYTYQCDPHAPGMKGTVTVKGTVKNYLPYTIANAKKSNADGKLDSLGKFAEISGIVHGTNLRPGGLQFVLIDSGNNGIGIFNATSDLGYTVKEGDKLTVKGTLNQFNGYAQVLVDVLTKTGTEGTVAAKTVTALVEADESSMVVLKNLNYVDVAEWKGDGSSFSVNVTDGTSAYVLRIDNDNELSKLTAPAAPFNATGWVNQNDTAEPFTEGYQLMPRYAADIVQVSSTDDGNDIKIKAYPNPTCNMIFFDANRTINEIQITDLQGRAIKSAYNTNKIDLTTTDKGMYFARLTIGDKVSTIKIYKH